MIDISNWIFSQIAKPVREAFPGITIDDAYVRSPSGFPHVTVVEADNYMSQRRLDTADEERYSTLMYEINVYSNKASGRKSECRAILNAIDGLMYGMNFVRLSATPVPNLEDATIYRITARYRAETDGVKLYRV